MVDDKSYYSTSGKKFVLGRLWNLIKPYPNNAEPFQDGVRCGLRSVTELVKENGFPLNVRNGFAVMGHGGTSGERLGQLSQRVPGTRWRCSSQALVLEDPCHRRERRERRPTQERLSTAA
jgi:hypothetical protein